MKKLSENGFRRIPCQILLRGKTGKPYRVYRNLHFYEMRGEK